LPPYFKNYGKRITKTSKLYFIDPGIAAFLTRQPSIDGLLSGPMGGFFFEGMVVSETLKIFMGLGKKPDIFFWRSHDGLEVDLLIQMHGKLYPIEIKMTATPSTNHLKPLNKFKQIIGSEAADVGILVCRVTQKTALPENNVALPWQEFSVWLESELLRD
jgi:predicted AAA+ superfamily ATPase